jgi:CRP/FNR family transcriptional regulator, cyclic AMP receptor protein
VDGVAPTVVHVVAEDPDLVAALSPAERQVAAQHLVAAELSLPRGPWAYDHSLGSSPADLGFLVLEGLLVRETAIGRHSAAELLGKGDLLRPWDQRVLPGGPLATADTWRVVQPTRVAVLDARFAALCARAPTIMSALLSRVLRRTRLLSLLLGLSAIPRLDARLLALLWHLADRWGHVGPDGTLVPLKLTHATVAQLVGAQRPSVTTALRHLEERGLLRRATEGGWLLLGEPPGDPEEALAA